MGKRERERAALLAAPDREAHLLAGSGLPGPRANLELLDAAGDVLVEDEAHRLAALGPEEAPAGTPLEFLPCCGLVALGRIVAAGDRSPVRTLRAAAADPRWRVREAVAIACQRWGDVDAGAMAAEVAGWADDGLLGARAAVAAVCEPRLLGGQPAVEAAVAILEAATRALVATPRPRGEPGQVLTAALGYGWSVAVSASPAIALPAFEGWASSGDPDVRRLVRANLGKRRFERAAPEAVARLRERMAGASL